MRLKKHLGQHLLVAKGVLERIADFLQVEEGDVVVEIGPGTGNLTKELLKKPLKELHLLEVDPQMVGILEGNIRDSRVIIHRADATLFDLCSLGERLKVTGNLPYNVASLILENTVFHHGCIPLAVYMLQKEVAEKLQKGPSWLSTFVRTFYRVEYLMSLPGRFFRPPPRVQSGLVRLLRKETIPEIDLRDYKKFLTGLYSMRRKALKNKLPEELLFQTGIDPMRRVDSLQPDEVFMLYNIQKKPRGERP
ncbi:MAG: 16S rRNA (adenine(1518)-N(6)/adenine(1519)-N(6))-dimethyltransferase RsmA [Aquificaceae bacterium]|jgi:16S rRNA (adenine1518-N6/adenine1519-N6)-dimethyltransferase|uniref:16S rRNA (adenine(1518)-N(6)/adenine(1519)-N(6))- dimethyltransferase RsmA n=1 Tax=Hydrogenobacter sp. Uz 6-8 TaxID=3384828 RepID=UPI0030AA232A